MEFAKQIFCIGLHQVTKVLNNDKFIAKYFPEDQDTDQDGLPDWYEWHEFGHLDHNQSLDPMVTVSLCP